MAITVSVKRASMMFVLGAALAGAGLAFKPAMSIAQDAANRPQDDMTKISDAFGKLRGQIADATKNEASLALLATIEVASTDAKAKMPPTIAAMPEADRPAKVAAYKKEMNKLIRQVLDAEDALLSGDNAKAGEAVTAMAATQREGHTEFRGRGGRGGGGAGRGPGGGGAPAGGGRAQ